MTLLISPYVLTIGIQIMILFHSKDLSKTNDFSQTLSYQNVSTAEKVQIQKKSLYQSLI